MDTSLHRQLRPSSIRSGQNERSDVASRTIILSGDTIELKLQREGRPGRDVRFEFTPDVAFAVAADGARRKDFRVPHDCLGERVRPMVGAFRGAITVHTSSHDSDGWVRHNDWSSAARPKNHAS